MDFNDDAQLDTSQIDDRRGAPSGGGRSGAATAAGGAAADLLLVNAKTYTMTWPDPAVDGTPATSAAFGEKAGASPAVDCAIDAAAAQQAGIGGVHDGVDGQARDVALLCGYARHVQPLGPELSHALRARHLRAAQARLVFWAYRVRERPNYRRETAAPSLFMPPHCRIGSVA